MLCDFDIFIDGFWTTAAQFELNETKVDEGYRAGGIFTYDPEFVGQYLNRPDAALSCRFPVNFELYNLESWPAFMLDLLPSGAARRNIEARLNLTNGPQADWPLLLQGAGNPIGNLRVTQAAIPQPTTSHPGFSREEIIERGDGFIEYAQQNGAAVSGSTGAQGDAPKFLLVEDINGRWHADRAVPDKLVATHWLVKFPRGKKESDKQILRNEEAFYRVAKQVGLHVGDPLKYDQDTLFIPRFDRKVQDNHVLRYGVESLCSAAGIAEFGAHPSQYELVETIACYSTTPQKDIEEFILRDVLNVAMGNTDNHPRNSAFLKINGEVTLSPLFDFAPMFLDDQGIARACRWNEQDEGGRPNWMAVADSIDIKGIKNTAVRERLAHFAVKLLNLPKTLANCGVDTDLIDKLAARIDTVQQKLRQ